MMSCYLSFIRLILKPIKIAMLFIVLSIAATYSITVNAFGVEKLRILIGGPDLPGIANHEMITDRALNPFYFKFDEVKLSNGSSAYFSPQAIHDIQNGNMLTDRDIFTASVHFDDESFKEGTERLFRLQQQIKKAALEGSYFFARDLLGQSLHSVQDFYAHTTWVEQHRNGIQLAPLGLQSFNGVPTTTATCSPIGIKRPVQLTSGYFSIDQAVVGRANYDTSSFFDSLLYPPHKCVHGSSTSHNYDSSGKGINKDNALRDNFFPARDYAVKATQQFVKNILLDLKDNPKAVCGLMDQKCDTQVSSAPPPDIVGVWHAKYYAGDLLPITASDQYGGTHSLFSYSVTLTSSGNMCEIRTGTHLGEAYTHNTCTDSPQTYTSDYTYNPLTPDQQDVYFYFTGDPAKTRTQEHLRLSWTGDHWVMNWTFLNWEMTK